MRTSRQIEADTPAHLGSLTPQAGTNEWRNRIVVVTGGNSGIGRAFVERLAAAGAQVVACGRNQASLQELQTRHPTVEALRCDITMRQEVLALVGAVRDRHGCLDALINNAGTSSRSIY